MNIRKLAQLSMFTVIAVTIFTIESALPALSPIQGIKLGLANIVTLVLLLYYPPKEVLLVLITRILLSSLIGGQMMTFIYSFCGGILCFLAMTGCNWLLGKRYIYLTSIIGAIFHNVGQLLAAFLILRSLGILAYLPILMVSGVLTGLFTGLCAYFFQKKMGGYMKKMLP